MLRFLTRSNLPSMGDIGSGQREFEFEPLTAPAVPEPAVPPQPQPAPAREPVQEPVGVPA